MDVRDCSATMDEAVCASLKRREAVDEWTGFVKKKGEGLLSNE